ncbi:MAG: tyrosine-type recombinase/integrase, partial [Dehalococcoidales bacterium]|nr:tyrosine-type recombinase/integrase [Dehalococcoidales bacterium]
YEPSPDKVHRSDITEYLAFVGQRGTTGISRARKLAAIREFFLFLETHDYIAKSPAAGVETPKKERNGRVFLRPEEYRAMLGLAGASPRDYAILQVFLQTGVRVSELCDLKLSSIDFEGRAIKVLGKGQAEREIELEKNGLEAVRNYRKTRPETLDDHLFLNKDGEPISPRMVRKIVVKYKTRAGITKKASCHSLSQQCLPCFAGCRCSHIK